MKKVVFGLALLIVAVLSGCRTSDEIGGGTAQVFSGQVANYAGPAGTLEALFDGDSTVGTGSIDSDGSFRFELEPTVAEAALEPITFFAGCDGVAISDLGAGFVTITELYVLTDDGAAGFIALADSPLTEDNPPSYIAVTRVYADREVTVQGDCGVASLDLSLKSGWNIISVSFEEDGSPFGAYSYSSGEASGVQWYYAAFETSEIPSAPNIISGQVADYDGPTRTLEAQDFNDVSLGTGSISADGSFTLELIEPAPELVNRPIVYTEGCPYLRTSDGGAKGLMVDEINVIANGQTVGALAQGSIDINDEPFVAVVRVYADRDVTVEGTCAPLSTDGESITTYDLDYEQGWNISLLEIESSSNTSAIFSEESTVSAAEVENIAWLYAPNSN